MDRVDDGGPAFPVPEMEYEGRKGSYFAGVESQGMTLLDYFAGQALVGLLGGGALGEDSKVYGEAAYRLAYAMMQARNGIPR